MKSFYVVSVSSLALFSAFASAQIGPRPYLRGADSPWVDLLNNGKFYLEDFEDGTLNTPGATAGSGSRIQNPTAITDSVDGDDGNLDGFGKLGHSYFATASTGHRFTFSSGTYGALPTHAGLVWTDGQVGGTTRFEAFDGSGVSLGVLTGSHTDGNFGGGTGEDRFYGWIHSGGIGSILMTHSGGGGLEVDHLQYGTVPEPATMAALGAGVLMIARRRQARK